MTGLGWLSIGITLLIVLVLARPVGIYLSRVFDSGGKPLPMDRVLGPIDKGLFKLFGIRETNQSWKAYAGSLVLSNVVMIVITYAIFRLQGVLPLNPSGIAGMEPSVAFNTAISFMANTNLQHYSGETGLSYLSQMIGIIFLMFTSPATGLAIVFAFMRGLAGKPLGNFFVDLVRSITRILLPIAVVAGIIFVAMGVPQTLSPTETVTTVQGAEQQIARGPVASLLSIKELGNNGGGFFGPNSTHPFENPNALSNTLQMILMMLVTTSLPFAYGKMVGNAKQGRVLFVAMSVMFITMLGLSLTSEHVGNPMMHQLGINGPSMEGKEQRLGMVQSSLYSVVTTASETGAVATMHDTLTPLGGLIPMANMMLNTVFGGIGVGFVNVLMYAMIAVFLSGLMVGRTPEFLGRKLESREMKLIAVTLIVHPLLILVPTAIALIAYPETISNPGYHGLSQALYEFTSSAANNGSGFEGLGDNTLFWNIATGIVMFFGRYISMITLLAVAGSMARKRPVPATSGTFRTNTAMFGAIFVGTVLIVGALTFFPVIVLGPVAEHLTLWK
ncbi:potassium-transporting ATPase subunit KdpA [Paenibacillus sp. UMB4589-SE434]|uniref:potassium-transporting ATPase subunit KdpA n=1 Tax=Paenibacillus sp. UMB4589-SE434 TaxID=3046314 RepID=UPI00254A7DB2|nr:potassium-transporting ATPase subunit KdpA [Paenibacillus sp. UMB4589-SE434]MDK8183652.1 potassium-transporting ATPase subunit KdpA [Paenibacillus sp. UMB4589-SE434]